MTVTTTSTSITYQGNNSTTSFSFPFAMPAGLTTQAQIGAALLVQTVVNGVTTVIPVGNSPGQYQVTLNAPVAPNPTPVGGQVTYNPLGGPLNVGSQITITRAVPFIQPNSFANQGTSLPSVLEQTHDLEVMLDQQVEATVVQAIVAPPTDPAGLNYTLPSAAARANSNLIFDASGNVTTGLVAVPGSISSVMAPVVNAATLAAARTNMGLGGASVENLGNPSIGDDGLGNLTVKSPWVADSLNQTVALNFNYTRRAATGPISYQFPLTSTLFNGFTMEVFVLAGIVTFTPNGADTFFGVGTGVSFIANAGTWVKVTTNGSGTWFVDKYLPPEDIEIDASIASNNLTVSVASRFGWIRFGDSNLAFGDSQWVQVPGNPSITFNSGTTFQQPNNRPFRIWIVAVNNGGVFQLAGFCAFNAVSGTNTNYSVFTINEGSPQSSSSSGVTAGVYFQGNNASFSSRPVRILGYLEFGSGLATAGVYNVLPNRVRILTPGMKRPGDTGQTNVCYAGSSASPTVTVNMESACNLVMLWGAMQMSAGADQGVVTCGFFRNATALISFAGQVAGVNNTLTISPLYLDFPNTTTSVNYELETTVGTQQSGTLLVQEIYV